MRRTLFPHWPASLFALLLALTSYCLAAEETPQAPQPAVFRVRLPADAELIIDGKKTRQTGSLRQFVSPPLQPGKSYHYTLKWSYRKDGKTVEGERTVNVKAGDNGVVDLLRDRGDGVKNTRPGKDGEDTVGRPDKKPVDRGESALLPREAVRKMLDMADLKKSDVVYNPGCGDGQLVVAAAEKAECKAFGFDSDQGHVEEAEKKAKARGVDHLVTVKKQGIYEVDLKPATVVLLSRGAEANGKLVPQLNKLKPGTRIVSFDGKIEDYPPKEDETVPIDGKKRHVYLWVAPLNKK